MHLSAKTLEMLRELINELTQYRKGHEIISFFAKFDYQDLYQQGFPSRWIYTDQRLSQINGTPKISTCIKLLFSPINFIDDLNRLDGLITEFNKYLQFDKHQVVRKNTEIIIQPLKEIDLDSQINKQPKPENTFIEHEFTIDLSQLNLILSLTPVIETRMNEIEKAFNSGAHLSVIILAGSTLEGLLLNTASNNPRIFNCASNSPKKDGKTKSFDQWTLNNFIDVAHTIGLIEKDTYRFSKELRDFRNYIHPFQQMSENFHPREQTAKICLQVLKSAINDICQNESKIKA